VELPGIDKKDVLVSVNEDRIEIKAEKSQDKKTQQKDYYHQERSYVGFYKSFFLPVKVDPEKAKMKFENGVLVITMPKTKRIARKKTLRIKNVQSKK
jgi:HSP20 family protein